MGSPGGLERTWEFFADLLEYPHEYPREALSQCLTLTSTSCPKAAARLREFEESSRGWTLGRLQEEYTRAFDLDETHSLYVGFHLLGESYKRSVLLLELMQRYRAYGIEVAGELADHLPVVLSFLGVCDDPSVVDPILTEAVWPVLEAMARKDRAASEAEGEDRPPTPSPPYHRLLAALLEVVESVVRDIPQPLVIAGVSGPGPVTGGD